MWTLSGFADEIDADRKIQFATLNDLGIAHVEFRSAWDTNVLDLTDEQIDEVAALLATHGLSVSSIGSPLGKINKAPVRLGVALLARPRRQRCPEDDGHHRRRCLSRRGCSVASSTSRSGWCSRARPRWRSAR